MKKLLIGALGLALAGCATGDMTPEQRQAKIAALVERIEFYRENDLIKGIEASKKTLLAVNLACDTIEFLVIGTEDEGEILAVVKPTCDFARAILVEKQKKEKDEPEDPAPVDPADDEPADDEELAFLYSVGSGG